MPRALVQTECEPVQTGDFVAALDKSRVAASDGSLDKATNVSTRRVGVGAAVFDEEQSIAFLMFSKVLGNQSVPRVELWAFLLIFRKMKPKLSYILCTSMHNMS